MSLFSNYNYSVKNLFRLLDINGDKKIDRKDFQSTNSPNLNNLILQELGITENNSLSFSKKELDSYFKNSGNNSTIEDLLERSDKKLNELILESMKKPSFGISSIYDENPMEVANRTKVKNEFYEGKNQYTREFTDNSIIIRQLPNDEELETAQTDVNNAEEELFNANKELDEIKSNIETCNSELEDANKEYESSSNELASANESVNSAQNKLTEAKSKTISNPDGTTSPDTESINAAQAELENAQQKQKEAEDKVEAAKQKQEEINTKLNELTEQEKELQTKVDNLNQKLEQLKENLNSLIEKYNSEDGLEETVIDLDKLLAQFNEEEKQKIIENLKQIPAEALLDLNNEVTFSNENVTGNASGGYFPQDDIVRLRGGNYSAESIVHELGHAIDARIFGTKNSNQMGTLNNSKFQQIFNDEMKNYFNSGKTQYSFKNGVPIVEFDGKTSSGKALTNYATFSEQEMFAECYTLCMLGSCQSQLTIQEYFPKTLECVKEILEETRNLPIEQRRLQQ